MNDPPDKPTVFISYSHKDEEWKDRLTLHLRALEQQGHVVLWDDRKIGTGDDWYPAIQDAMANSAVAVCLITPNFLASDFINKEEIPFLLERRQEEGMLLLPIYVRPCAWKAVSWLKKIQMFPAPPTSLASLGEIEHDQALADLAEDIFNKISDTTFTLPKPSPVWAALADEYVSIERLPRTGTEVFGRAEELTLLDQAWESETTRVISFVAWGGVGKSALVNKWVEQIKEDNYRGAKRVYAWSFYSQGTDERVASADMFVDKALRWFGDSAFADTNRSGWDKGQRLAELVQQERTLLLLDGLEPLQSGYKHDRGQVKDPALRVVIEELGKKNPGLCVITTREALPGFDGDSECFVQKNLEQISAEAGRSLLRVAGIRGTDEELEQATRDFGNHALAINLLAAYLQDMPGRDVQHARLIPDLDIPEEEGRHPRRVMEVFGKKFEGQPELNVLNMMGLFDRPATIGEITALRTQTEIPELTDRVHSLTSDEWERTLHNLRSVRLLAPQSHHDPGGLDAHPLVREHFGQRLKEHNEAAWKQGHSHLYEYLSKLAPPLPDTLEQMAPLFLAVTHGCAAGRHHEAYHEVLVRRVQRGNKFYSTHTLGALGAELEGVASFFVDPWRRLVEEITPSDQAFLLNHAGYYLRALGRLSDAVKPMTAGLKAFLQQESWKDAARVAGNLSELHLDLGDIDCAVDLARQAVLLADRSGDEWPRVPTRTRLADALHQAGRRKEAQDQFRGAERLQVEQEPEHPLLYSTRSYRYCDFLLEGGLIRIVLRRALQTLKIAKQNGWLLDIALDHLSLGRAYIMATAESGGRDFTRALGHLDQAVAGVRGAGRQDYLPRGLIARAELRRHTSEWDKGKTDLDEAMTIATRGEMRRFECDCHLEYARLHLAQGEKHEARKHLVTGREMVDDMGYHRRDAEVLLIRARLELLEGDRERARQTLAAAKKRIDEMGCHRWDIDAAEIEAEL